VKCGCQVVLVGPIQIGLCRQRICEVGIQWTGQAMFVAGMLTNVAQAAYNY